MGTSALTLKKHCLLPFLLHCVVQDTPPHLPSTHKLLSNATFTVADKVHISALYRYHEWRLPAERLKTTADFRFRLTMLYCTHLRIDISMTDQHLMRSSPLLTTLKFTPTACNALNALEHTDCEIPNLCLLAGCPRFFQIVSRGVHPTTLFWPHLSTSMCVLNTSTTSCKI